LETRKDLGKSQNCLSKKIDLPDIIVLTTASCQNDECVEFDKLEEREILLKKEYGSHNMVFEYWTYKCPTCGTSADFESEYEDDGYDG
jgi:hypothetical protein